MLNLTNRLQIDLNENDLNSSLNHIYNLIDNINIPSSLKQIAFPENFLDHKFYFIIPKFFKEAFGLRNKKFINDICNSGYFYFKYLLCLDSLTDQDMILENEELKKNIYKIQILQSHIYHEQALMILGYYFGKNDSFWKTWEKRNNDFLKSIQMDSFYNIDLTVNEYEFLCVGKCSFTNVAVDVFNFYCNNENEEMYDDLVKINNFFSIGRCILDDIEDFKKDLIFKKNNLGHVFLNEWLKNKNLVFNDYSNEELEKLLISTGVLEKLLTLSIEYLQKAILICEKYDTKLVKYKKLLSSVLNSIVFYKVQTESYRVDVLIKNKTKDKVKLDSNTLNNAISISKKYITSLQFQNGSWYENSNKQGLSNLWATGFISSFLSDEDVERKKSVEFLNKFQNNNLWGYNTDWSYDFDSTTCALINVIENNDDHERIKAWQYGQNEDGGFSTYSKNDTYLLEKLNLKENHVKGWVQSHVCVSALAYYFVVTKKMEKHVDVKKLKQYLLSNTNKNGVWDSYWWTSPIYSTCFIIQSLINENEEDTALIKEKIETLLKLQAKNGSFVCPLNKKESAFYSALVLDTICLNKDYFELFSVEAEKICKWLLDNQLSNGSFENTNYQVIPNPNVKQWKPNNKFVFNSYGAGNSITGEQYALFTTSIALRAFRRFSKLKN
ncbi:MULTISPECIES: prenyltransferase/squalene oxidase repeat-containing protein [Flavobacterium]|uniref:Squalene cyclase C-terminal domain-containing protein n=1 Tax=Flavobacterium hankyongi TaxID=1176532 RepID=A0ABP8ZJB3_9FLAO|nr:prenyltransferase/squalene oxidase repeat-containing protein [Flavobacterium sp. N1846]